MMRSYHNSISNVSSNNDSNNHNHNNNNNNTNNKYNIGSSSSSSGSSNGAPTMNFQPPAPKLLQTSEPHAPASLGALFHMHDDGNRDDEDLFIDVDINTLASSYNMNMNTTSPSSLSIASSVSPIDYHQHSSTHLLNNNQQQQQQQQLLNSFNLNGSRRDIIVHNSRSNNTNYRNYFDDLDGNSVDQDDDDDDDDDDQAMLPIVPIPEGVASVVELGSENIKRQYELDQLKYEQQKLLLRLNSQKRVSQSLQMISMRHPKPFDLSEAFPLLQQQQQHQQQQQQAYSIFSSSAPMINNNNSNRLGQWQSTTTSQSLQPQSQMQRQQQQQSLSMSRIAELCNNATIRSTLKELSIHNFDTIDDWRDMCSKIKVVANEYPHIMTDMYPIVLCKRAPLITDCNGEYEKLFAISKAELKSKKTAFYDFMPEPLRQGMATLIDNINTRQVSAKDTVLNLEPKYNFKALIPDIYYVFNTRKIGMDMRGNVFEYVKEAHCMCDPWDPFHLRLVIVIVKQ